MKKNPFSRRKFQGYFIFLISLFIAVSAMVISVRYQFPETPACRGMMGAGFPVLFICDNWGGGSPTNSWGKITFVDVINGGVKPIGFVIDLLFYTVSFYLIILLLVGIYRRIDKARKHG